MKVKTLMLVVGAVSASHTNQDMLYQYNNYIQRSSLDHPEEDHTKSAVAPNTEKEETYSDFLVQKKQKQSSLV